MTRTASALLALAGLVSVASPQASPQGKRLQDLEKRVLVLEKENASPGIPLRAYWKQGLHFASPGGDFRLKLGGRIQNDWTFGREDRDLRKAGLDFTDGVEFRRARFYLSGRIYRNIHFKAQYDFAGGNPEFKDVWISLSGIPFAGTLKAGHFKEPFSLDELTSSKYLTFMERALPNTFAPSRNTGFQLSDHPKTLGGRLTWAIGLFREAGSSGNASGGDSDTRYNLTARVTGLPWYEKDGARLLHLGLGWSRRDPEDHSLRYKEKPESHLAPVLADTGILGDADSVDLLGLESALVYDSLCIQGEYTWAGVDSRAAGDPDFSGWYLQGSWFLTGEHRPYKKSAGHFGRVKPRRNFTGDFGNGPGAWEVALRLSRLDLDGGTARGGKVTALSTALNWYLNPNTRVMLNYIHPWARRNDPAAAANYDGAGDIFQARFQVDF